MPGDAVDATAPVDGTHTGATWDPFPGIDLRQLVQMSDDTGIFQHALYATPDARHGYCIDDNARALIAALLHAKLRGHDERAVPLQRYLAFLAYAFNEDRKVFRNFMSYDRKWLEDEGSHDSQGRTFWALGLTVLLAPNEPVRDMARSLMLQGMEGIRQLDYLRSWAFALIGLDAFLKHDPTHQQAAQLRDEYAQKLFDAYQAHATPSWPWWEDLVVYDNAKLSHALLVSGQAMGRPDMIAAGLESLHWLLEVQTAPAPGSPDTPGGHLSIIGNDGWLPRDGSKAKFDQQPLEAYAMVHACLTAATITADASWADHAWRCFQWFTGKNDLGVSLYDPETGGCKDGLQAEGANKNQGAESSLAYLLSVLELHLYRQVQPAGVHQDDDGCPAHVSEGAAVPADAIGYGLIGAGQFGQFCLEQYRRLPTVALRAVAGVDTQDVKAVAAKFDLHACDSVDALLARDDVQLVHIATPPTTHHDLTIKALEAGKHVLCEKPLATNLDDARRMIDLAAARGRMLSVNLMMRYDPLCQAVKAIIDQQLLGLPLHGFFENYAEDQYLGPEHWFWQRALSGGIFIEHGVHFFDLFSWWLDEGRIESAQQVVRPGSDDIVEQVHCTARYAQNVLVNFYHGFTQAKCMDRQEIRLVFERGSVRLFEWVPTSMEIDCLADEATLDKLKSLLPHVQVDGSDTFDARPRAVCSRHKSYEVDGRYQLTSNVGMNKQALYGHILRSLLADQIQAIGNPRHQRLITEANGLSSLAMAATADAMARAGGN